MLLPDWLTPLPDAAGQGAIDAWAIEEAGISSLELMERAGDGLARLVQATVSDGVVCVLCGTGNNGGDGFVAARLLRGWGREVRVVLVGSEEKLTSDARTNFERLGLPVQPFSDAVFDGAAVIIDALLGTGTRGAPRAPLDAVIESANASGITIVAADCPSGVDASSGEIPGVAIRAVATATFAAAKPGLWIEPGRGHAGTIKVIDIGIPPGAPCDAQAGLIRQEPLLTSIVRRTAKSSKFTSGIVVVAGGATAMTGAPVLAARAAMRAGAGYVTACVPALSQPIVAAHVIEVMTRALPEEDGGHTLAGAEAVLDLLRRGGVLLLGPGLGRTAGALAFVHELVARAQVPLLLDADGLFAYSAAQRPVASDGFGGLPEPSPLPLEALRERGATACVLTPHEGELARLLGDSTERVRASRLACVRRAAALSDAIVVLKGDDTLIARPDGVVAISPGGTPALATAGTGDVLSGVVAALLSKGMEPFAAACAAVRLHARAALAAAAAFGSVEGVVASDVVTALARART